MQFGRGPFTTAVYQKSNVNAFQLPAHVKPKEDMELKDIVMDHALPYLPAKSLMRFRSVSKEWDQWIMSPFLSHKQSYNFRDMSGYFYQHQDETKASFISLSNSAYGVPDFSLSFLRKKFVLVLPSERAPGGVLTRFHGELCYVCVHNEFGNLYSVDIYGNMDLKHSVIFDLEESNTQHCRVLPCINSDFVMILVEGKLYCYHLKDQKFEVVPFSGILNHQANYMPYVNSLVTLL
ncbi:F-box At5g49610-like [Olea europaea subsp. europaea]|uniref:F-box At5g49610-like n=1 Tax=Olea europaea subsp. europaea TaxID=158383 RepID=A0A8S0SSI3_OLEEU|nr:F-box At5g49610-like [Olea europaea subsp. europaea]